MVIYMEFTVGERIKSLREDKDLTQKELGDLLNMTQRKLSYIENNKYEPSVEDIKAICSFFKISADFLLGLE